MAKCKEIGFPCVGRASYQAMMKRPSAPKHRPADQLVTRHVFLDTQVYRELGHNPANPALTALKQHIDAHRIVLHTADITLAEVRRQIQELVLSRARELGALERDFRRWRKQAPGSMQGQSIEFDTEATAAELFETFEHYITRDCGAYLHHALEVEPKAVFDKYFARKPPFDGADSKEFPDAFVLEALSGWAEAEGDAMYVVTKDGAMGRAASVDPNLRHITLIQDVLTRAGAALGPEAEAEAEELVQKPDFDPSLMRFLEAQMPEVVFIYSDDQLPDGEAYGGELVEIEEVGDWSLVSLTEKRVVLLLDARVKVLVEVQYEDRDGAFYDREDGRWYGGEDASMQLEDSAEIELLVEISRTSGEVVGGKVLTSEIKVSGPHDYDY